MGHFWELPEGLFISEIKAVQNATRGHEFRMIQKVQELERNDPSDSNKEAWLSGQKVLNQVPAFFVNLLTMRKVSRLVGSWPKLLRPIRLHSLSQPFIPLWANWLNVTVRLWLSWYGFTPIFTSLKSNPLCSLWLWLKVSVSFWVSLTSFSCPHLTNVPQTPVLH